MPNLRARTIRLLWPIALITALVSVTTVVPYWRVTPAPNGTLTNFRTLTLPPEPEDRGSRPGPGPGGPATGTFYGGRIHEVPGGTWIEGQCFAPTMIPPTLTPGGPTPPPVAGRLLTRAFGTEDMLAFEGRMTFEGRSIGFPFQWLGIFETDGVERPGQPATAGMDGESGRAVVVAWAPFAATTGTHTAVVAALVGMIALVKRVRRTKDGCCPGCGHQLLDTQSQCPECGVG